MKELNCDLHIVGAALTGLLTAYCASNLGYKVIISETITDHVVIIPIHDIQLSTIKTLAGL